MAIVLVIDDRAAYREIARAALEVGGHEVIEASDGLTALHTIRTAHPDLVIADVLMPGVDGLATYVNPRLSEITGVPAADLLGAGWHRCLPAGCGEQSSRHADGAVVSPRRYGPVPFGDTTQRWLSIVVEDQYDSDNART